MGDVPPAPPDLFFEGLIREYTAGNPRFLRRDWLSRRLALALQDTTRRFILLKGEPGSGKSSFMAQLARDNPTWLRYFIRRDQRSALSSVSTKSFLLHIGLQLACIHAELFAEEQLRVSIAMRLGQVAEGGQVVGAEVKRLVASPFHKTVVQIEQNVVGTVQGRVLGLKVDELVANAHLLETDDLLNLALIDPARALERKDRAGRLVILIDAIDEVRYHTTPGDVLEFLTNCPELPPNIQFVVSSRPPDGGVQLLCAKQKARLADLSINRDDPEVIQDVSAYATKLVADLPGDHDRFTARAVEKANGNLGYLDALARAIDHAVASRNEPTLRALLALQELPSDLNDLYAFFLHQIKHEVARQRVEVRDAKTGETFDKDAWPAVYSPILGVLAVALEPVGIEHIVGMGGILADRDWVGAAVDRLTQFLEVAGGRYRLYHATVPEFLTAAETRDHPANFDLYQDAARRQRDVVDSYWKRHAHDWTTCTDGYALRHLARHLFNLSDATRLDALICKSWMIARRTGPAASLQGFADDVSLAILAATMCEPAAPEVLARLHVARQLVLEDAGAYGDTYLEAMVALGRIGEAVSLAKLRMTASARFRGLVAVYRSLPDDSTDRAKVAADAEEALRAEDDLLFRSLAMSELGALLTAAGDPAGSRLLDEAIDLLRGTDADRRFAWREVAGFLADAGDARAVEIFRSAVDAAAADRTLLQMLAEALSRPGLEKAAPLVLEQAARLSSADSRDYIRGWVCHAHVEAKRFDAAEKVIRIMREHSHKVAALCQLAGALAASEPARARRLLERAVASVQRGKITTSAGKCPEISQIAGVYASLDSARADALFLQAEQAANAPRMHWTNREHALTSLVVDLVRAGRLERARELALTITEPNIKLQMQKFLVPVLADAGQFADAEAVALSIRVSHSKDLALASMSRAFTRRERFDDAERVIGMIDGSDDRRAEALRELVDAFAARGHHDRAVEIATAMPRVEGTEDALASLAIRLARSRDRRAADLLARAGDAAAAAQTRGAASSHDDALLAVVRALSMLGDHQAAEHVARLLEGWDAKVSALISAAEAARAAAPQDARRLFDEAVRLADAPVSERRLQFFRDISVIGGKNLVDPNVLKDASRRKMVLAEKLAAANEHRRARQIAASIALEEVRAAAMSRLVAIQAGAADDGPLAEENVQPTAGAPAAGTDPIAGLAPVTSSSSGESRRPTDEWVERIARAAHVLDRAEPGRGKRVLASALDAAGWIRPDWAQVSRIVAPSSVKVQT